MKAIQTSSFRLVSISRILRQHLTTAACCLLWAHSRPRNLSAFRLALVLLLALFLCSDTLPLGAAGLAEPQLPVWRPTAREAAATAKGIAASSTQTKTYNAATDSCFDGNDNCLSGTRLAIASETNRAQCLALATLKTEPTADKVSIRSPQEIHLEEQSCTRTTLTPRLRFISDITIDRNSNRLIVLDYRARTLTPLELVRWPRETSKPIAALQRPKNSLQSSISTPTQISSTEEPTSFGRYQAAFSRYEGALQAHLSGDRLASLQIYDGWQQLADGILAFGAFDHYSVANAKATKHLKFRFGLFWIAPGNPAPSPSLLMEIPDNDFYSLNLDYIATTEDAGYFLDFGSEASIIRVSEFNKFRATRLLAFPPEFRAVPRFSVHPNGRQQMKMIYEQMEASTMPVGLYSDDGFLFLLTRSVGANQVTNWDLHKIDPRQDSLSGTVRLPTHAKHLALVPTSSHWLLFEKGEFDELANQFVNHVTAIPKYLLSNPSNFQINLSKNATDCLAPDLSAAPQQESPVQ